MKEHPILFSTPMVQAILEGRKTQTRRILKSQPGLNTGGFVVCDDGFTWVTFDLTVKPQNVAAIDLNEERECPYGMVGDILWVRETWLSDPTASFDGKTDIYYYKADLPEGP